jgi:hypothetical protein
MKTYTVSEFYAGVAAYLQEHAPHLTRTSAVRLAEIADSSNPNRLPILCVTAECSFAFGLGANISVDLDTQPQASHEAGTENYRYSPNVAVSWSAVNRRVMDARAACDLYQKVLEVACRLEVIMRDWEIVSHRTVPSP